MLTHTILRSTSLLLVLAGSAFGQTDTASDVRAPVIEANPWGVPSGPVDTSMSPTAEFLLSKDRLTPNDTILFPGFINGLRGFEHFYDPIGNPLYFETPFNQTSARLLFLHHEFADGSQLQGGDLNVWAAQVRVAITERLALIATKDGYSQLDAGLLPEDEGWNDIALGLKYVLYADKANDLVITPGIRYQAGNGDAEVLQSGVQEFSPFISFAKGFGDLHFVGNLTGRIPLDEDRGNHVVQWSLHADYEVFQGVAPVIEIHGLHYVSDGDALPLSVGGLDYANIGSSDVSGSTVIWMGVGGRVKLTPNITVGSTFEFALTNRNADIMDQRVTVDVTLAW
jgi:hypothetical protein